MRNKVITESQAWPGPVVVGEKCLVLSHGDIAGGNQHLVVEAGAAMTAALPGQFFHLLCPGEGPGAPFLRRPMSCYRASTDDGVIEFLYRVVGLGTAGLARMVPGDTLDVVGPLGRPFRIDASSEHILILARGVGLATLAPLADAAARAKVEVTAICSFRGPDRVVGIDRFKVPNGSVVTVFDSDDTSSPRAVGELITAIHAERPIDAVYTCGSRRLVKLLQDLSARLGFGGEVAMERQMACGLGMCHSCVADFNGPDGIEHRRVCVDGPVFPLAEISSW